jgi:hypothetical protein
MNDLPRRAVGGRMLTRKVVASVRQREASFEVKVRSAKKRDACAAPRT